MNGNDVGVREPGDESGLKIKSLHEATISSIPRWKDLDGDISSQIFLMSSIYPCHPPLTDRLKYAVIAERCSYQIVLLHRVTGPREPYLLSLLALLRSFLLSEGDKRDNEAQYLLRGPFPSLNGVVL